MAPQRWRWVVLSPLVLIVLFVGAGLTVGCCVFSAPGYQGPRSDHFDGMHFFNQGNVVNKSFRDLMKWRRTRKPGSWRAYLDEPSGPAPPHQVGKGELRVTFINHATTLVQVDGVNILTDPIWSKRASPLSFVGPRRVRPPGIRFEDLPRIHVVLVSHNHYDHMDVPTLRRLSRRHKPLILAGLGNHRYLRNEGVNRAKDLDWWQHQTVGNGVRITFVPAQHFSMRGLCDRNKTLWGGFVIESTGHKTYFAGDTGFGPHFAQIRQRFGPLSVALLPIGAYLPRWFMKPVHLSPADAVRAFHVLEARHAAAIHFGTFPLADDAEDQPVRELRSALKRAGISDQRFWVLGFGEGRGVAPDEAPVARNAPPPSFGAFGSISRSAGALTRFREQHPNTTTRPDPGGG